MPPAKFIYTAFLIFLSYFVILDIYYLVLVFIGFFEERKRVYEFGEEDYFTFSKSPFTIPVSIIIPAHNEEDWIIDSVHSVLNLDYPQFEVIVVDDGSTDKTLEVLNNEFKLKPSEKSYDEHFHFGKIHAVYNSKNYPNVTVISEEGGYKKAGALNIGLNFAKYKYVCVLDADTILEPDALFKVMSQVEKDPENIIGIGSYFGLVNGFKIKNGKIIERHFSRNPIIAYQNLEYVRSFIGNRVALSRFNSMPNVGGSFGLWRRDILLELGGYSPDFSSEDLEFTFRAQDYIVENQKKGYKIMMLPYYVGWTEAPNTIGGLILQRSRWQRVTNETVWRYKHMIFNPKHKRFGFLTFPYFLFYEVLGVFFEVSSITLIVWGALLRILDIKTFIAYILLMILLQALVSLLSIFAFIRDQKLFNLKDISYLLLLSFFEFFWYRWIIIIAKLQGMSSFLRKVREFDQYKRVKS